MLTVMVRATLEHIRPFLFCLFSMNWSNTKMKVLPPSHKHPWGVSFWTPPLYFIKKRPVTKLKRGLQCKWMSGSLPTVHALSLTWGPGSYQWNTNVAPLVGREGNSDWVQYRLYVSIVTRAIWFTRSGSRGKSSHRGCKRPGAIVWGGVNREILPGVGAVLAVSLK